VDYEIVLVREDLKRGPDVDETPRPQEQPELYVLRVACAKAEAAALYTGRRAWSARPVLAADTTVVCDGRIIGKPADREDAFHILKALSGRKHEVITGVAVAAPDRLEQAVSVSSVWFRHLADDEIRRYVATGEPLDKAGAYAIQGLASRFIPRIDGSYANVVGLPVTAVLGLAARLTGAQELAGPRGGTP